MKATTAYWPVPLFGQRDPSPSASPLKASLNRLWHGLMASLDTSDEPRVWPGQPTTGQSTWNAYDPVTGKSVHLVSEAELRVWLENLHYDEGRDARDRYELSRLMANH